MTNKIFPDAMTDDDWSTYSGHPASGTRYQELTIGYTVWARIIQDGHEVVSPSTDTDGTYKIYNGRVARWIEEAEELDAGDHAAMSRLGRRAFGLD